MHLVIAKRAYSTSFVFMVNNRNLGPAVMQTLIYYTMFRPRCVILGG